MIVIALSFRMPRARCEEHFVDPAAKASEFPAPLVCVCELVGIDLRTDLPRMWSQHQNARSDDDRLLDRVGDEEDGRTRLIPEFEQVVLHLPPSQGIECGEGLIHQ